MPTLKLRQDTVRTLPHQGIGKQQCVYWDEALECFGLRGYPSGRRVYVCTYRINRRKRLALLGRADVLTLDQARKKAMGYLGKAANQEDPLEQTDQQRQLKTVGELCTGYVENHAKKKKKKWKEDESYLNRHILPKLKSRLVINVASADIEPIHSEVGGAHPYAANRIVEVVRKIAGLVPKDHPNPAVGIVRFRERKRFITTAEMPRFIAAPEREDNIYARHGIWLLLLMGVRSIELLKAKWVDVDWDMGTLFVGLTKNGEPLLAPLSEFAIERLKIIPRITNNPYIICGRDPSKHLSGLGRALKRVLLWTNLGGFRRPRIE